MNPGTDYDADILIVGGGVAGCTAAIALTGFYRVILIDKQAEPVERVGECLPPAARRIFRTLSLLEEVENGFSQTGQKLHLTSIGTRSYWGSGQAQVVDHIRNPDGFGWHLDRRAFEKYLRETASQRGVSCLWGQKLNNSHYENSRWQVAIKSTGVIVNPTTYTINAKFVIDASGRQSCFARQQAVKRTHFDKLVAYWATLPDDEENKMSTISSGESGWWYSAPLPNKQRVLSLQTDSDITERGAIKDVHNFIELAKLNKEMAAILDKSHGAIEFHGAVAANSGRLDQAAGKQWAALGDAAMSFDPLSSQGMFNGLAGALQLAELIIESGLAAEGEATKMDSLAKKHQYQMDQIWEHYVGHKNIFYNQERRWTNSIFWKRRSMPLND